METWDREFARDLLSKPHTIGRNAYLSHGQIYERLNNNTLRRSWVEALRKWLDYQSAERGQRLEYLTGELNVRGLPTPVELAPEEVERLKAAAGDMDDDEMGEDDPGDWSDEVPEGPTDQ